MSNDETFENYRLRREIEQMEQEFKKKAVIQRQRVERLIASDEATVEVERQVQAEMQEFLTDSTTAAEKMLAQISTKDAESGQTQEELRSKLDDFLSELQETRGPAGPAAADVPALAMEGADDGPLDLQAALDRIRKHGGALGGGGPAHQEPPPPPRPRPGPGRGQILHKFDNTLNQVSDFLVRQVEDLPAEVSPGEKATVLPPLPDQTGGLAMEPSPLKINRGGLPPIFDGGDAVEFVPDQRFGEATTEMNAISPVEVFQPGSPAEGGGGSPAGLTNMFEAEPGEDRDIDDHLDAEDPEGWNIPRPPPPPGAWVVEKQKEEGEGGLAGMAGDSYLMKKVFQEVRSLNRVYLVLLEKGVVTRAEVEGKGSGPSAPRPSGADEGAEDDVVTVEDYEEERYRPILTSDKDFSLSSLVEDVHRLKTLREVLLKKGVVTQKDLKKAGG